MVVLHRDGDVAGREILVAAKDVPSYPFFITAGRNHIAQDFLIVVAPLHQDGVLLESIPDTDVLVVGVWVIPEYLNAVDRSFLSFEVKDAVVVLG